MKSHYCDSIYPQFPVTSLPKFFAMKKNDLNLDETKTEILTFQSIFFEGRASRANIKTPLANFFHC